MHNGEWSLVSFTLLSQLSVGLVLALGFLFFMHNTVIENLSVGFSLKAPEFIVLILMLIATTLSFLHLGSPQHAYHSLNNIKGSWISREILMLSLFGFAVLLFMMSRMLNWQDYVTKIILLVSILNGLVLIFVMSGIYLIPTVPSWNHFNTPLSFFGSVFMLGSASMLLFLSYSIPGLLTPQLMRQFFLFMLVITSLLFISSIVHFYQLSQFKFTGIEPKVFTKGWFLTMFLIRCGLMILILLGLSYLSIIALDSDRSLTGINTIFLIVFILIFLEEVMGRYLFYSGYFRMGI